MNSTLRTIMPVEASSKAQASEPAREQPSTATKLRSIGIQTEGQERPVKLLGGLVTYVDDLLLAMPEVHLRLVVDLLLKKYVMKQSGIPPSRPQKKETQIGFLGCSITRHASGAIFCDQEKYILHQNAKVYRTTDVAGHTDKAGYLSCPWHLRFHDGEDSSSSCLSFG